MGEKRSLSKVGKKFNVSAQSLAKWRRSFDWDRRTKERDERNALAVAKKTDSQIVNQDAQNIKIARAAIKVFAQSLIGYVEHTCKCGEVIRIPLPKAKLTADQFDKMVRLDRFILGEPDSRPENKLIIEYRDPLPRAKPVKSKEMENE